jgi:hypothetical protein
VPRYITHTKNWLTTGLGIDIFGWVMTKFNVGAGSWILIMASNASLAAATVTRGHVALNAIYGQYSLGFGDQDQQQLEKTEVHNITRFMKDCDNLPQPIFTQRFSFP